MNIAQNWRLNAQRYSLIGTYNEDGSVSFPPRPQIESRDTERYAFRQPQSNTEQGYEAESKTPERIAS